MLVHLLLECEGDWFVVGESDEVAGLQHVAEMFHSLADGQQLPVVATILLLRRDELPEKKARFCQAFFTPCCSTASRRL
jgi:hypothetical protein